ncbi:MAG TPA: NnrU family protein [Alphaproteobacteria bacterium]|nr:NnrU family protein [Alphaproteobacteria bacterium]
MSSFWIAFAAFVLSHSVLVRPALRLRLVALLGRRIYLAIYSALSLGLLIWLLYESLQAPRTPLWPWHHAFYWLPNVLMPLACMLLVAGALCPNPLSVLPGLGRFDPQRPNFTLALTRHPVLWAFFLWSFSHILPNGEMPHAFMFAFFAAFSLLGLWIVDRKKSRQLGPTVWQDLSRETHAVLFLSPALWRGRWHIDAKDICGMVGGLVFYAVLYALHATFFGISPLPPLTVSP